MFCIEAALIPFVYGMYAYAYVTVKEGLPWISSMMFVQKDSFQLHLATETLIVLEVAMVNVDSSLSFIGNSPRWSYIILGTDFLPEGSVSSS